MECKIRCAAADGDSVVKQVYALFNELLSSIWCLFLVKLTLEYQNKILCGLVIKEHNKIQHNMLYLNTTELMVCNFSSH